MFLVFGYARRDLTNPTDAVARIPFKKNFSNG
jgi:hypothetical protein